MKPSVRLAAKAHSVALIVILCGMIGGIASIFLQPRHDPAGFVAGYFFAAAAIAFVVALVSAFHIAVCDALQRMEQREKTSRDVDHSA